MLSKILKVSADDFIINSNSNNKIELIVIRRLDKSKDNSKPNDYKLWIESSLKPININKKLKLKNKD